MYKFFKHPLAGPFAVTVLQFAVLAGWVTCSLPWFLEPNMSWVVDNLVGLSLWQCISGVVGLIVFGAAIVLTTIEMPVLADALAEGAARWVDGRRGRS